MCRTIHNINQRLWDMTPPAFWRVLNRTNLTFHLIIVLCAPLRLAEANGPHWPISLRILLPLSSIWLIYSTLVSLLVLSTWRFHSVKQRIDLFSIYWLVPISLGIYLFCCYLKEL